MCDASHLIQTTYDPGSWRARGGGSLSRSPGSNPTAKRPLFVSRDLNRNNLPRRYRVERREGQRHQRQQVGQPIARGNKDKHGDLPARNDLLIRQLLVGSDQDSTTIGFGGGTQSPVIERRPPVLTSSMNCMARDAVSKWTWDTVIQQDRQSLSLSGRSCSLPMRRAPSACSFVTEGKASRKSFRLSPASR